MANQKSKLSDSSVALGNVTVTQIHAFDDDALSALTTKIEKGLGEQKSFAKQDAGKDGLSLKSLKNESSSQRPRVLKVKPRTGQLVKGTKRDVDGNAKHNGKGLGGKLRPSPGMADVGNTDGVLLGEILALGGTKEDLELVANAVSDEEEVSTTHPPTDKLFRRELVNLVADLGIQAEPEDNEPDTPSDIEVDEEWEETSNPGHSVSSEDENHRLVDAKLANTPNLSGATSSAYSHDPDRLIFEPRPDWHAAVLPVLPTQKVENKSIYSETLSNLKDYARSLLEKDNQLYALKHLSASSHRFLATIMSSGTLSDKVSALTLVVQESPVHTRHSLENLLSLARKRSRGQAVIALGALKDLLGAGVVLPAERRLRNFENQPGLLGTLSEDSILSWRPSHRLPGKILKVHLISWAYEDWLKKYYFEMLKILESWCNDEIEYARSRAVTYVYELLREKPEQEANLLRLLVNKLGDPDKKISSRASYLILQLQVSHPLMRLVIVRCIESELLLRPGQSTHAKYYAISTLNQTVLSSKEEDLVKTLLKIYFELFVSLLKKPQALKLSDAPVVNRKGQIQGGGAPMGKKAKSRASKEEEKTKINEETNEKLISAVLSGVNRAFPFSKADDVTLEGHMDTLFRITHSSNFNTSIQALMLIEQLATTKNLSVDRFYRTLYESLLDPRLTTSSKHALYLNLLFRSLRSDLNIKRVKAFAKRLMQIITLHDPPFICGIIFLLWELESTFPGLKTLRLEPEEQDSADFGAFYDVPDNSNGPLSHPTPCAHQEPRYDGRKRDPEHSCADRSCLWELIPFLHHFHPSVSLFAARLLEGKNMPSKPDLASHTLSSFLDRFVYRNAKATSGGPKGNSIMQPLAGGESKSILISKKATGPAKQTLNSETFWRKKAEDVAVDEVFFHNYFNRVGKKLLKTDGDIEEDQIWQSIVNNASVMSEVAVDMSDNSDSPDIAEMSDFSGLDVDASQISESEMSDDYHEIENLGTETNDSFVEESAVKQTQQPANNAVESTKAKRQRLKHLPLFAAVEEYEGML